MGRTFRGSTQGLWLETEVAVLDAGFMGEFSRHIYGMVFLRSLAEQ